MLERYFIGLLVTITIALFLAIIKIIKRKMGEPQKLKGKLMNMKDSIGFKEYQNLEGRSGIVGYRYSKKWIDVKFSDGSIYRWVEEKIGQSKLRTMKNLADNHRGLHGFINTNVKNDYHCKHRF